MSPGRCHRMAAGLAAAATLLSATALQPAAAQVAPTPQQIATYTGLHGAAQRGDVAAIERLAPGARADLAARDGHGRTPLDVATFAGQAAAVRALLLAGADPAALDHDRYDAVTIAAVADDEATLRVLLAHGASARLTDAAGNTPLQLAQQRGYTTMAQMLAGVGTR